MEEGLAAPDRAIAGPNAALTEIGLQSAVPSGLLWLGTVFLPSYEPMPTTVITTSDICRPRLGGGLCIVASRAALLPITLLLIGP